MVERLYKILNKKDISHFSYALQNFGYLYAPIKKSKKAHSYDKVESLNQADFDYVRTMIPPKKFFISPKETIFTFDKETDKYIETPNEATPIVIFGVHSCDINALNLLSKVYLDEYADKNFLERKKNTMIIGISCSPDKHCFCKSTGTDYAHEGFELFLHDIGDRYLVRIGSIIGYDFIDKNKSIFTEITPEDIFHYKQYENKRLGSYTQSIEISGLQEILELNYESPLWEEYGSKCLSCGSCNLVCPRCRCYDVQDYLDLNLKTGNRVRKWYSCMLEEHGLVAGGLNFRATSKERIRNRINCKGSYKEEMPNCVGCGRCTVFCPANIDYLDIMKRIRGEFD